MSADLPPLYLEFKGDIKGIQESIKKIEGELKGFSKSTHKAGEDAKHMGAKTVAAGAIMASIFQKVGAELFKFGKETMNAFQEVGGEVIRMRRVLGGTPEEMSRLRYAGEVVGVTADKLTLAFRMLSKHLVDNDKVAKSLNITYRDAHGQLLPTTTLFANLAERFSHMKNGAEKTALAVRAFGRSGTNLIPVLNLGKKGLEEMYQNADKLGLTLSGKDLQSVREYTINQRELHAQIQGIQLAIGRDLLPKLSGMVTFIRGLITLTASWVKQHEGLIKIVGIAAAAIAAITAAIKLQALWTKFLSAETGIYAGVQAIATAATEAFDFAVGVLTGEVTLLEAPFWLIIAAIAAFVEALFYTIRHSKTFVTVMNQYFQMLGKFWGTVISYLLKGFAALMGKVTDVVVSILRQTAKLKGPLNAVHIHWADGLEKAADSIEKGKNAINDKLLGWAEEAPTVGQAVGKGISDGLVTAANFDVMGWLKGMVGNIMDLVPDLPQVVDPTGAGGGGGGGAGGKGGKKKKAVDEIKEMQLALQTLDTKFGQAKASAKTIEQMQAVAKAFKEATAKAVENAKAEEKKTRGTKDHAAAVRLLNTALREQTKVQQYANKVTDEAARAAANANKQQEALNNTLFNSSAWLATHAAASMQSDTGTITVPVSIDGKEVFRAVQAQATQNSRRNISNGLTFTGAVL